MRRRVMIVDDDREVRESLRIRMTATGFLATTCASGREALKTFEETHPQLVLLDAALPDLSGPDVCERIRERDPNHETVVIFVSGASSPSTTYVEQCAALSGADGFIRKPYEFECLLSLADQLCKQCAGRSKYEEFPAESSGVHSFGESSIETHSTN